MDLHRAVERTLLVLIWLATSVQVAFSDGEEFSVNNSESWNSTTTISDNTGNSTAQQQQANNEFTTLSMLNSSTATDVVASGNAANESDARNSSTASAISTDSNATDANSSAATNGSAISDDAGPKIPVNNSDSNTTTTTTAITYGNESLTNANTTVVNNGSNSTTTEPGSKLEDVESDGETSGNTTEWGSEGNSSWSNGTTQEKGNGVDDSGVTGVSAALGAENPFPGEPGSWNSTTAVFDSAGNTTQQPPGAELPAAPINSNASNTVATTTAPSNTSATPANPTNDTFASSASSTANNSDAAQNFPADNSTLNTTYTTSSYFTDANTTANNSNSLKTEPGSNTTVNGSEGQLNGTDLGTDNYTWSGVTTQSIGGAGGSGGGGNWSNATGSVASNSTEGNRTTNMTTASPSFRTILCYNCSGNNCSRTDNDTATCVSNAGTCYIQYDAVATALSYSCAPLLASSNGCPDDYATRVYDQTVCEMCCTTSLCNSRPQSEMEQMCRHQFRSSVDALGGGGGGVYYQMVAALIAAIHYCTFGTASFGDW